MKNVILLLFTAILLVSCSKSEEVLLKEEKTKESEALLGDINYLEEDMAEGRLFAHSTREEMLEVRDYLFRIRVLVLRLNQSAGDSKATYALYKILKKLENFDFETRDSQYFVEFLKNLRLTIDHYASVQGINFSGLEWEIYSHDFANGFDLFQQIPTVYGGAVWEMALDRFAKIGGSGRETDNWLVSPKINLQQAKNLSLKISHTVRNPNWENFKALISSDYNGADPRNATWRELDIRPSRSVDPDSWVDLETNDLDISEFSGEKVVLAFRYLSQTETDTVWEISSIDIKGTGEASVSELAISYEVPVPDDTDEDAPETLVFEHSFKDGMEGFSQSKDIDTAANFREEFHASTGNFVRISSYVSDGENMVGLNRLISPEVNLESALTTFVQYTHAFKYYPEEERGNNHLGLQVAEVTGGELMWVDLVAIDSPTGNDYTPTRSGWIEIPSELQGKSVVFSFKYDSTSTVNPVWDLHKLEVRGN